MIPPPRAAVPTSPRSAHRTPGTANSYQFELLVRSDAPPGSYTRYRTTNLATWAALRDTDYNHVSTIQVDTDHHRITIDVFDVFSPDRLCYLRAGLN